MTKLIRTIGLGCLCILLASCYVIDIQQGNIIHPEKVNKLRVGMSKEQVRYIMGSPVLESAFNDDQWDYVYTMRDSRRRFTSQHVGLTFKNNKLQIIN